MKTAKGASPFKQFDAMHIVEAYEHSKEIKFDDEGDTHSIPPADNEISSTANFFGDFYFHNVAEGVKHSASKIVEKEMQSMRERLHWDSLAAPTTIPKGEFQSQLLKSKFLSLFLVMRRITGKHQRATKAKAFRHWVEWKKAYVHLYRSRPGQIVGGSHTQGGRSRSASPNTSSRKAVNFAHHGGHDGHDDQHPQQHQHHHPSNYHFHGERHMSPQQMRQELYLHRDMFLTSQDEDAVHAVMHHLHPHAANHPEQDFKYMSPKDRAAAEKRRLEHQHQQLRGGSTKALVPSHIVSKHTSSSAPPPPPQSHSGSAGPRSRSRSSSPSPAPHGYHFHGDANMTAKQVKKELYLHHDLFLTSQDDDVVGVVLNHAHPHSPHEASPVLNTAAGTTAAGTGGKAARHTSPPVPSHVVRKVGQTATPAKGTAGGQSRSNSAKKSNTPMKSPGKKELHLHHDMFLTSQDDDVAQIMINRSRPHSPNRPFQESKFDSSGRTPQRSPSPNLPSHQQRQAQSEANSAEETPISRYASPKQRASFRLQAGTSLQQQCAAEDSPKPASSTGPALKVAHTKRSAAAAAAAAVPVTNSGRKGPSSLTKRPLSPSDVGLPNHPEQEYYYSPSGQWVQKHHFFGEELDASTGGGGGGAGSRSGSATRRPSCRGLDVIVGAKKDAHEILLKGEAPAERVKAIHAGQHHKQPAAKKKLSPSVYASGGSPVPLKPFNMTRDKKHAPKPRQSLSPSRVLAAEHAEALGMVGHLLGSEGNSPGTSAGVVGAFSPDVSPLASPSDDAARSGSRGRGGGGGGGGGGSVSGAGSTTAGGGTGSRLLRAGSPHKALSRALSILATPSSDAIQHDHRTHPHQTLHKALSVLSLVGHDHLVQEARGAATATDSGRTAAARGDGDDVDDDDYDDESHGDTYDSGDFKGPFTNVGTGNKSGGGGGAKLSADKLNRRLTVTDLTRGLSIHTRPESVDGSTYSDDVSAYAPSTAASTSPMRKRASFSAPTVSHILKLAHKSDVVEKVAATVEKKRANGDGSIVKKTLPKSTAPHETFEIVPAHIKEKRAARRTSFRSPTKSHAVKVAAKQGDEEKVAEVLGVAPHVIGAGEFGYGFDPAAAKGENSPLMQARRRSFSSSVDLSASGRMSFTYDDSAENELYSIRTIVPFAKNEFAADKVSSSMSRIPSIYGTIPPRKQSNSKLPNNGTTNKTSNSNSNSTYNAAKTAVTQGLGMTQLEMESQARGLLSDSLDDADDTSVAVYDVDDDLDNLFDPRSPKYRGKKAALTPQAKSAGADRSASINGKPAPDAGAVATAPAGKRAAARAAKEAAAAAAQSELQARQEQLNSLFVRNLDNYRKRVEKTTTAQSAFDIWKTATGWARLVDERIPQSILYMLQVEKVSLKNNYLHFCLFYGCIVDVLFCVIILS
jgi:hypothetical protein